MAGDGADLDAEDLEMFNGTAVQYQKQAEELSTAAKAMGGPTQVTPGEFDARGPLATALNDAHQTAATAMDDAQQGVGGAYAGSVTRIGSAYQNTKELSVQALGSMLNAYDKAQQAGGH